MGAYQGPGARFWNRSPVGLDASFLDEHDHARSAKARPATPITERDGFIYVPTDDGVVYAVDRQKRQVRWAHKLSNAMLNRIWPLGNNEVLVTTMDGKVARLRWHE